MPAKACLTLEADHPIGIVRKRLWEDFDGDVAAELRIARAVDLAHAADADALTHLVRRPTRRPARPESLSLTG